MSARTRGGGGRPLSGALERYSYIGVDLPFRRCGRPIEARRSRGDGRVYKLFRQEVCYNKTRLKYAFLVPRLCRVCAANSWRSCNNLIGAPARDVTLKITAANSFAVFLDPAPLPRKANEPKLRTLV